MNPLRYAVCRCDFAHIGIGLWPYERHAGVVHFTGLRFESRPPRYPLPHFFDNQFPNLQTTVNPLRSTFGGTHSVRTAPPHR